MERSIRNLLLAFVAVMFLSGCGSMLLQMKADSALQSKKYDKAIPLYEEMLESDSNNVQALRGIGATYLEMKKGPEAVAALEKAYQLDPVNRKTMLNLGLSYMLNEEYDKTIDVWRSYTIQEPDSFVTAQIAKQLTVLRHEEAARWASGAVRQGKDLDIASVEPSTIAVTYFGVKGVKERSKPLQKALAAMIITDLSKVQSLKVVERVKLQKLLEEMQLDMTEVIDSNTSSRVGRLLGAGNVITGNIVGLNEDTIRIDSVITDVISGKDIGDQDVQGLVDEFFKVEKAIVFAILDDLGVKLSDQEKSIVGKHTTRSYMAIKYYGEGLDAQDEGEWDEAIRKFSLSADADYAGPGSAALASAPSSFEASADIDYIASDIASAFDADEEEAAASAVGGGGDGGGG